MRNEMAPHCHYHPGARLVLVDCQIPFLSCVASVPEEEKTKRQIFRCPVAGCPVVVNGPSNLNKRRSKSGETGSMIHTNPW